MGDAGPNPPLDSSACRVGSTLPRSDANTDPISLAFAVIARHSLAARQFPLFAQSILEPSAQCIGAEGGRVVRDRVADQVLMRLFDRSRESVPAGFPEPYLYDRCFISRLRKVRGV
jgi:hypothetical protein